MQSINFEFLRENNPELAELGAFTEKYADSVFYDSHVMRVRCNKLKIIPSFFYIWLLTEGGRCLFMKKAGRTAVQFNINAKQLCSIEIPVPPLPLQQKFAEIVKQTEATKQQMQQSAQQLDTQFNALIQKAFKGELYDDR